MNISNPSPHAVKALILFFLWLEYFWELYLDIRQFKLCVATTTVPRELKGAISGQMFNKIRNLHLHKLQFGFIRNFFGCSQYSKIIEKGWLGWLWNYSESGSRHSSELTTSCIWLFYLISFSTLVYLPFTVYITFVLENNPDLNLETVSLFIWDSILTYILKLMIGLPIAAIITLLVKHTGDWFFLWLWLITMMIYSVVMIVFPLYIAPLFENFTPLPEGQLKDELEELSVSLDFPVDQLYVVEKSQRTDQVNAYFTGFFGAKRIVMYDTLLPKPNGYRTSEVMAILAHEFGHWKLNHIMKYFALIQINSFLTCYIFAHTYKMPAIYQAVGFDPGVQPALVGFIVTTMFVMQPYNMAMSLLFNRWSRHYELQADAFAKSLHRGADLQIALVHLHKNNMDFPVYDPWYSAWYHSHPPLLERLRALRDGT